MKQSLGAAAALLFTLTMLQPSAAAESRAAQWKAVEEAISQGLPQTAISNLQPILVAATKEKAWPEATKALAKRIALEGAVQGNKPEEKITRLEAEIAKAPTEMKPLLQTILANWYWHYFQQNKWRFMQRTQTAEPPGKDFTTWDLPRLFAEIDRHFQAALAAERTLKATPIGAWDGLLVKGTLPDSYRPILYDFIAQEALEFYTSGEQAGAKPEDAFELAAESPALDASDPFLAWWRTFPTKQFPDSPIIKALTLYGALLAFHEKNGDPAAFLDVDLARLAYAWNSAFGESKNERYKAALKAFVDKWADHELSALARHQWARVLQQEGDLVGARKLALQGAQSHPNSPGGKLCQNLIAEIEAKSASVSTERVWNGSHATNSPSPALRAPSPPAGERDGVRGREAEAGPTLTIRYRNVDAVYFRAIPANWEKFLERRQRRPENLSVQEKKEWIAKPAALEWSAKLPPTTDFKERTFAVPAPTTLKPGFYFIAASHDPKFGEAENLVSFTDVWVSELALITRQRDGLVEGFVLEAESGEPLAGAEVSVWHLDNAGNRVRHAPLSTDTNGFFSFKPEAQRGHLIRARHQGRELASQNDLWAYDWQRRQRERPEAPTVFFTDRAIYRPGQTISYKGIHLRADPERGTYQTIARAALTVVFLDPNGKEIARAKHTSNDYGSIQGAFTAPRDRLMGQMRIAVERGEGGTEVSVEEYKRPKFEVTLDAPKTAPKLNEKVTLTGHATSYTGAAVDGATVKYRVTRQVRWPWWWSWWRGGGPQSDAQEIAHGAARTETDGSFKIEFTAKPDPKVLEKDEPTFVFEIHADVTDAAGETRSDDRSIRVGYTALEATLSAADWQTEDKPVEVKVRATTLDGEAQVAEGNVKVYELEPPAQVQRAPLAGGQYPSYQSDQSDETDGPPDLSTPNHWPLGKVIAERGFTTDTNGTATLSFKLPAGPFRAVLETQDRFGKKVTGRLPLLVLAPDAPKLAIKVPHLLASPDWSVEPGAEFMALWGTGYDMGRAFVEIEHRSKMVQRYWTLPGRTQQQIKLAVTEAMRGGFTLHVTQVRENRGYLDSRRVEVPWSNKELELRWAHFTSKLQPGQKETWTLEVRSPQSEVRSAEKAVAELVAALYDESLDQFIGHNWPSGFGVFYSDYSTAQAQFLNFAKPFQHAFGRWDRRLESVTMTYREFPPELGRNVWGYGYPRRALYRMRGGAPGGPELAPMPMMAMDAAMAPAAAAPLESTMVTRGIAAKAELAEAGGALAGRGPLAVGGAPPTPAPKPDLSKVAARKNLNETAFFFPQLTTDSNGVVSMSFTMPEALAKWRFLGFAHDRNLRAGLLEAHAVTAKDLMVQPNPPRFLREGDTIEFTVKVSNQNDKPQDGTVRLSFADVVTQASLDKALGVVSLSPSGGEGRGEGATRNSGVASRSTANPELPFSIPAKESRTFAWRLTVPDGCGFLSYKAVAASATVSDGEEGGLPVLSRRIFVTESLPLPIRGKVGGGEVVKKFEFKKLLDSGKSRTLQHQSLTVQMVSQPAWYAVMALPYLMEYPYECSEQTFNRLYANALARHIANSDPKIRRVFDLWKNTPALDSPLEKNQDLKAVLLEETPWLRQAQAESQARRNVGLLFDDNRLNSETDRALQRLREAAMPEGGWSWFPGGPRNDYMTLYITTGFGRLRHLGVDVPVDLAQQSLQHLDAWMTEHYERIQRDWKTPEDCVPSSTDALYLYGRSFFLKDQPVAPPHRKAVEFFLAQSRKHWLKTNERQTQGHLAIALKRFNASTLQPANDSTPMNILRSLKERSVTSEELGRFWRDTELSWWWYRAPIETQALMIEAFDEVAGDAQAVEDCRVWLLKQKQTQDWKTTKATADAVYALLLRGKNLLGSDALVEVKLGGVDVTPKRMPDTGSRKPDSGIRNPASGIPQPEPGPGFYEVRFAGAEVKPKFGDITVRKTDDGVSWGSVHWQYLEDMTKVTPYEGTPLKLKKALFTKVNTARGPVLEPVKGPLAVGDELVVRVELRVDRDMEYVHLKDQRGSGTEPVNVLSRYKYQDGLGYYESTRDTASHFFIAYLPKGTYVFEYSTRIQLRGNYQTGMASIQCMYAPEFNSHSESIGLNVR